MQLKRVLFLAIIFLSHGVEAGPLMPEDHPAKAALDQLFFNQRITHSIETMEAAGFVTVQGLPNKIYVAKHRNLNGYLIKTYLGNKNQNKQLWERAFAAAAIERLIDKRGVSHLFKVPKKWVYSQGPMTVLLVEDMQILSQEDNFRAWWELSDPDLLRHLFFIVQEAHLVDLCATNIPFCLDGKIAFIDTIVDKKASRCGGINKFLNFQMLEFWLDLTDQPSYFTIYSFSGRMPHYERVFKMRCVDLNQAGSSFGRLGQAGLVIET